MTALRAELFRLLHDRWALFWGFVFFPLIYLMFVTALDLAPLTGRGFSDVVVDMPLRSAWAASTGGNPIMHLFAAAGAAAIFGGEYRFATWRLVGPRAPRGAILAAKYTSFATAAAASLVVMVMGVLVVGGIMMIADSVKIGHALSIGGFAIVFLVSLLELLVIGSQAALLIVLTRAPLAGVLPPFLFSLGQVAALAWLEQPPGPSPMLALPAYAGDLVRRWALGAEGNAMPQGDAVLVAFLSLIAWYVLLNAATWVVLRRQDWSRE